jgi:hypothetical protein
MMMVQVPCLILADSADIGSVILRSLLLIALVVAGFFAVIRLRRWLKEEDHEPGGIGFTLGDLRALHRKGEITDEQFERARTQMLAGAKAMAEKLPDPLARSETSPASQRPQRPR